MNERPSRPNLAFHLVLCLIGSLAGIGFVQVAQHGQRLILPLFGAYL